MTIAKFYYKSPDAPKPNKPTHIGAAAIVRDGDRVLLERRCDSDRWSLIGGGLKVSESLEECLAREVIEETGLEIKTIEMFEIFSDPSRIVSYPDGNVLRIVTVAYVVSLQSGELVCSDEIDDV